MSFLSFITHENLNLFLNKYLDWNWFNLLRIAFHFVLHEEMSHPLFFLIVKQSCSDCRRDHFIDLASCVFQLIGTSRSFPHNVSSKRIITIKVVRPVSRRLKWILNELLRLSFESSWCLHHVYVHYSGAQTKIDMSRYGREDKHESYDSTSKSTSSSIKVLDLDIYLTLHLLCRPRLVRPSPSVIHGSARTSSSICSHVTRLPVLRNIVNDWECTAISRALPTTSRELRSSKMIWEDVTRRRVCPRNMSRGVIENR